MTPHDTSPAADEVQRRRIAEMTPAERINIGVAMWQAADSLQRAALRREYPNDSEEDITFRIAVIRFGEELARKAYRR
jgi:hypothetical protein